MRKSFAIISAILLVALAFQFTSPIPQAHASGYSYYRAITIQGSQIATVNHGTLSNFTVLVCANGASPCNTTVSGLNESGTGADVTNASGYDIVFSTSTTCSPLLNWEMEKYVPSTGEMEAWVKIPSLSYNTNQTIYMCYGNSGISSFQGGSTGSAWDSNYTGVWHFPNGSTLSAGDSTGLNSATIYSAVATSGVIDGGASFSRSNSSYIDAGNASGLSFSSAFSASFWVYPTIFSPWDSILGKEIYNSDTGWLVYISNSSGQITYASPQSALSTSANAPLNTWTYVTVTNSGGAATIYMNGVANASTTGMTMTNASDDLFIGSRHGNGGTGNTDYFDGDLDEVHVSSVARSADWIVTEYNNESAPSTFESFGSQIGGSSGASVSASVLVVGGGGGGGGGSSNNGGGGGGGGGYQYNSSFTVSSTAYTVTVGAGGAAGNNASGSNGGNSVFSSITAIGGGGGGVYGGSGASGGSGGGGGRDSGTSSNGTGSQGYNGGPAAGTDWNSAGGGGGAGAVGNTGGSDSSALSGTAPYYSSGGIGMANSISGSSVYYAGGGAGSWQTGSQYAFGGQGGGGNGSANSGGTLAVNGTANTGGGGGGGQYSTPGNGGSGIVIISIPASYGVTATGGTETVVGGNDIWTFTSSGTWTPTIPSGGYTFAYSRAITLQGSQISTVNHANLSNFTVLVCANGSSPCNASVSGLNQSGGGAQVQNANGYDIVFSTNAACSSMMNWEMEKYVASTGEMEAWVKIPATLAYNQNYTFYMCYGNSSISSFQGGSTGSAWDSSYKAVWHFPNGSSLSANDSTLNGNNGTVNGATAASGLIDGGAGFTGTENITVPNNASLNLYNASLTMQAWVYPTGDANYQTLLIRETSGSGRDYGMWLQSGDPTSIYVSNVGQLSVSTHWAMNAWNLITVTEDGSNIRVYVDGVLSNTTANTTLPENVSASVYMGYDAQESNYPIVGTEDEVSVSNVARSADWIMTQYNNQSAPGTFESFASPFHIASPGFSVSRTITLQGSHIATAADTSVTNYTALICGNGSSPCNTTVSGLNETGGGAQVQNANGYDIVFGTNSSCSSLLNWEMEKYVSSTGEFEAWVNIPTTLTYNTNYTFYMCYGNSGISSFEGGSTGSAWDSGYAAIYHFANNGSSVSGLDSTSNANNATGNTALTGSGAVAGGAVFNSSVNNVITLPALGLFDGHAWTVSGWMNQTAMQEDNVLLFACNGGGDSCMHLVVRNGTPYEGFYADDLSGGSAGTTGQWYDLAYIYNGSPTNTRAIYLNGTSVASGSSGSLIVPTSTTETTGGVSFGPNTNATNDELRISSVVRSPDWIATEYNNESSPSTFETFGAGPASSGGVDNIFFIGD